MPRAPSEPPRPDKRSASRRRFDAGLRRLHSARYLIGVDEAGRGPLAGPVLAAAVRLSPEACKPLAAARDSKLLAQGRREALFELIRRHASGIAVAWAHPAVIDRDNILRATLNAMRRAVLRLPPESSFVVVDGPHPIPSLGRPHAPVVGGDDRSLAVACAAIVAKVLRDRWMTRLNTLFPGYGLAAHKGYGTKAHLEALARLGPSRLHRWSYEPVRAARQACIKN